MKKRENKMDKITGTILAAFILMSGVHFNCRYNIGPLIDTFFHKVSAEAVTQGAPTPLPLAAAPVTVPAYVEALDTNAKSLTHKSIARNPFSVPAAVQPLPMTYPVSSVRNAEKINGINNPVAVKSSPILRGVIHSGDKSVAIIEYQGVSKAYNIGQNVGAYTLESINDKSVDLDGKVLSIGGNS